MARDSALLRAPGLVLVKDTPKGRGVFATQSLGRGTVLDVSPVLVLTPEEVKSTGQTSLQHYTYYWPAADGRQTEALALGLGSMFNHARIPNVTWSRDVELQTITYTAARDIEAGEELCISYGMARLWFKDADADAADEDDLYTKVAVVDAESNALELAGFHCLLLTESSETTLDSMGQHCRSMA